MIIFILLTKLSFAINCNSNLNADMKLLCQTEGKNAILQMIEHKNGCEFPEGQKKDCIIFKECGATNKEGRTFILKGTNLDDYCLLKDNLFSVSANSMSSVYSYCEKDKFMGFKLRYKGDKISKLCTLNWTPNEQLKK